jgi:hypothetical protein
MSEGSRSIYGDGGEKSEAEEGDGAVNRHVADGGVQA